MLPLLTAPWALAALASLPALAALYWLRNTRREVPVSSLMFWMHQSESQASGLKMRQLQTPLLFFLEIAALLLLAFAATGPRVDTGQGRWPLAVVLDDSFSMQAGGEESARRLAAMALERELRWGDQNPVRLILASDYPQALGDTVWSWTEAQQALTGWRCRSATARLSQAVALAGELSGDKARILVISDHGPSQDPGEGRVQWWSFGRPRGNVAFVNAARSTRDGQDRCLLEIANLDGQGRTASLILETSAGQEIHREALALEAHETRRISLRLPKELAVVRGKVNDDALNADNVVSLVREESPVLRVEMKLRNEALRAPFLKALESTGKTAPSSESPHLLLSDDPELHLPAADTWIVQVFAEKDAESYVGPFVLDRTHPLTEGIHLAGVVWGAGAAREIPGAPVILAGGVPLVTDVENLAGQHHLRWRLRSDLATLLEAPAFPVLVWNLVHWRAQELPGLRRVNARLGESVHFAVPLGVEAIVHLPPNGESRTLPASHQRVTIRPNESGLHEIQAGESRHTFAVNNLQREESDLTGCVTGRWGEWSEDLATAPALYHLAWIPLVLVLGVLTLHMALASRAGG